MSLADFESYRTTHEKLIETYKNREEWNRMSLMNIASSGYFAADRAIEDYARDIWNLKKLTK